MIDEIFLQNAVRIRRTYLRLSSDIDEFHKSTKKISDKMTDTIDRINELESKVENAKKTNNNDASAVLNELLLILSDIEKEGKSLEDQLNPVNLEIEKLAIEEQELYRKIKERHYDLTDEQIISSVRSRLEKENLS